MLSEVGNRKSKGIEKGITIEDVLNQKVKLDTEIMDFLFIEGWGHCGNYCPVYTSLDKDSQKKFDLYLTEKRKGTFKEKIRLETRLANCISSASYLQNKIKTINDFKNVVENQGLLYRNMGLKSLAHFNNTISKHEIKPLKIGSFVIGYRALYKDLQKKLTKYELELAKR